MRLISSHDGNLHHPSRQFSSSVSFFFVYTGCFSQDKFHRSFFFLGNYRFLCFVSFLRNNLYLLNISNGFRFIFLIFLSAFISGLKKIVWPLLVGLQIVKTVLLVLFLPSIIGSLGKIVGKGKTMLEFQPVWRGCRIKLPLQVQRWGADVLGWGVSSQWEDVNCCWETSSCSSIIFVAIAFL